MHETCGVHGQKRGHERGFRVGRKQRDERERRPRKNIKRDLSARKRTDQREERIRRGPERPFKKENDPAQGRFLRRLLQRSGKCAPPRFAGRFGRNFNHKITIPFFAMRGNGLSGKTCALRQILRGSPHKKGGFLSDFAFIKMKTRKSRGDRSALRKRQIQGDEAARRLSVIAGPGRDPVRLQKKIVEPGRNFVDNAGILPVMLRHVAVFEQDLGREPVAKRRVRLVGKRVQKIGHGGHQPAVRKVIAARTDAENVRGQIRFVFHGNALRMRHLVRHGYGKIAGGNVYVNIRFRIKGKINARNAKITHRDGQDDLFRPHFKAGKIRRTQGLIFFVQNIGKFVKRTVRNDVPLPVPFEFCRRLIEHIHKIFCRRIDVLFRDLHLREAERRKKISAVIERRI